MLMYLDTFDKEFLPFIS